ncbi:uncharacterized protein si:dkey-63d15.12 [Megalobrama amblycephala]|uniref:uncharacterized protein si:dkey-63d15.12 n=1 Tax=Megalobrama amblycephala TaxID=75352 RepID=UPI002014461D|nr:uncharacterized protein si:dkey-63d15.12 [Megalobrama amblycephala]
MTRTSLCALFATIWFTGLISEGVTLPNPNISVWQKPQTIKWKGTSENITCHIKAHSQFKRIVVKWLQDNKTEIKSEKIELSDNRSSVSGTVLVNASLDLLSIRLNHSAMYYCTAQMDLPILGFVKYGNGTHVYVVSNSTTVTKPSPTPETVTAIPMTLMVSLTLGLSCVLLIICIGCAIHRHYKGHSRIEPKAKEAVVDATHETPCPETHETVVYAALNIPRDSVKSRNENSAAVALTPVTCTEDSVTYSEVHMKKGPKDEG